MSYLVTLKLGASGPDATVAKVRAIPGLEELDIDDAYGLVCVSPKRGLYVVRVRGDLDESLVSTVEEVTGVHGEVKISTFGTQRAEQNRKDP